MCLYICVCFIWYISLEFNAISNFNQPNMQQFMPFVVHWHSCWHSCWRTRTLGFLALSIVTASSRLEKLSQHKAITYYDKFMCWLSLCVSFKFKGVFEFITRHELFKQTYQSIVATTVNIKHLLLTLLNTVFTVQWLCNCIYKLYQHIIYISWKQHTNSNLTHDLVYFPACNLPQMSTASYSASLDVSLAHHPPSSLSVKQQKFHNNRGFVTSKQLIEF